MTLQNLTSSAWTTSVNYGTEEWGVVIPAGVKVEFPTTVFYFDGVTETHDSWTLGQAYIYHTGDGEVIAREVSVTSDFLYGAGVSLPFAVTLLFIWAIKRGLRPSLENM